MSIALEQTPSALAGIYLRLSNTRRKIIQFILYLTKKNNRDAFPSIRTIAKFVGCSESAVHKFFQFNEKLGGILFRKTERFAENGRQTSNLYGLNKDFVKALDWLKNCGYFQAAKSNIKKIISSMKNEEKYTLPPSKSTPLYKDLSYKDGDMYKKPPDVPISSQLREFGGMPLSVRTYLSKNFSERVLLETKKSYEWWFKKTKIYNPVGTFIRIAQRTKKRLG